MTFCTHRVIENSVMKCPMRVGKGAIEVNPDLCANMTDKELEERLRVEVIRILLKHPYDRQPECCSIIARALGSNCIIGAGALVPQNAVIPDGSLVIGMPAKVRRAVTEEEISANRASAAMYREEAAEYKEQYKNA